jgi:hypothetical protein
MEEEYKRNFLLPVLKTFGSKILLNSSLAFTEVIFSSFNSKFQDKFNESICKGNPSHCSSYCIDKVYGFF